MLDVLFICPVDELELQQEINGTMLLATKLLQAGYNVDILRFCQIRKYKEDYTQFVNNAVSKIIELSPRICSFYALWPYYHTVLRIAKELKKIRDDIIVIFGGPQATLTAEETLKRMRFVDYICAGEGENTIVPFVRALVNGTDYSRIPGVCYRRAGEVICNQQAPLTDLDTLPHWDDRLIPQDELNEIQLDLLNGRYMPIDAGRGCPFSCTFCCTSTVLNRTYRLKSARRIVEDISYLKNKYGITKFWLSHDALTTNKKLISEVCDLIIEKKLNIKWQCTTRIDLLSEDLILKMKRAGLAIVDFGVETGSERMQKIVNKKLDLSKVRQMVRFLLKNKIRVTTFFMYGFPEETEQDLNDTMELFFSFLDEGVQYSSVAFCRFYPRTKLVEQYYDKLIIDPEAKKLKRDVFGYENELPWFREHKSLFTYFYNLNTPVRDQYQYLYFLGHLYQRFPNSIKHLRRQYKGNNLQFFKDFYESNRCYFDGDISELKAIAFDDPMQMINNMMDKSDLPFAQQLKGLMKYDWNIRKVSKSGKDISIQDTYEFSYLEFVKKIPVEQYSNCRTELLIQKVNGKVGVKVLRLDVLK